MSPPDLTRLRLRRRVLFALTALLGPPSWLGGAAAAVHGAPASSDERLPTLLLIGHSQAPDELQGLGPADLWNWRQVIARYLDTRQVKVLNLALGQLRQPAGYTPAVIKAGDVALIVTERQRGAPEAMAPSRAALRDGIATLRALGATPVLCTPPPPRRFDAQGHTVRGEGGDATRLTALAREHSVACIDLAALIAQRWDALGPAVVTQLFPRTTPEERMHTNRAGAVMSAQVVLQALRQQRLLPEPAFACSPPQRPVTAPDPRRPTLFIVGDSTVRSAGRNDQWGWGERLAPWFNPDELQLANHAIAGRSTRTFLREGRWAELRAQLQPGDAVLIQFGHNDSGRVGDPAARQRGVLPGTGDDTQTEVLPDGTVESVRSFGAYLAQYLREALDAGAVPIVVSPVPHKDHWQDERDFADFSAWGREVAQREGALFVDLTLAVTEAYRALGAAEVERLFADANTHTNDAGAKLNAACIARLLRDLPGTLPLPRPRAHLDRCVGYCLTQ